MMTYYRLKFTRLLTIYRKNKFGLSTEDVCLIFFLNRQSDV